MKKEIPSNQIPPCILTTRRSLTVLLCCFFVVPCAYSDSDVIRFGLPIEKEFWSEYSLDAQARLHGPCSVLFPLGNDRPAASLQVTFDGGKLSGEISATNYSLPYPGREPVFESISGQIAIDGRPRGKWVFKTATGDQDWAVEYDSEGFPVGTWLLPGADGKPFNQSLNSGTGRLQLFSPPYQGSKLLADMHFKSGKLHGRQTSWVTGGGTEEYVCVQDYHEGQLHGFTYYLENDYYADTDGKLETKRITNLGEVNEEVIAKSFVVQEHWTHGKRTSDWIVRRAAQRQMHVCQIVRYDNDSLVEASWPIIRFDTGSSGKLHELAGKGVTGNITNSSPHLFLIRQDVVNHYYPGMGAYLRPIPNHVIKLALPQEIIHFREFIGINSNRPTMLRFWSVYDPIQPHAISSLNQSANPSGRDFFPAIEELSMNSNEKHGMCRLTPLSTLEGRMWSDPEHLESHYHNGQLAGECRLLSQGYEVSANYFQGGIQGALSIKRSDRQSFGSVPFVNGKPHGWAIYQEDVRSATRRSSIMNSGFFTNGVLHEARTFRDIDKLAPNGEMESSEDNIYINTWTNSFYNSDDAYFYESKVDKKKNRKEVKETLGGKRIVSFEGPANAEIPPVSESGSATTNNSTVPVLHAYHEFFLDAGKTYSHFVAYNPTKRPIKATIRIRGASDVPWTSYEVRVNASESKVFYKHPTNMLNPQIETLKVEFAD